MNFNALYVLRDQHNSRLIYKAVIVLTEIHYPSCLKEHGLGLARLPWFNYVIAQCKLCFVQVSIMQYISSKACGIIKNNNWRTRNWLCFIYLNITVAVIEPAKAFVFFLLYSSSYKDLRVKSTRWQNFSLASKIFSITLKLWLTYNFKCYVKKKHFVLSKAAKRQNLYK